jgi:hypothetical protein
MSAEWGDPERCEDADGHFAYTALSDMRLCGCGYYDMIVAAVLDMLRACPLYEGNWTSPEGFGEFGAELLLHVADGAGLIEHGTSISGSWIPDKGKRLLAVTDGKSEAWFDDLGGFCCSNCPPVIGSGDTTGEQQQ